jgi:hypothetical protein
MSYAINRGAWSPVTVPLVEWPDCVQTSAKVPAKLLILLSVLIGTFPDLNEVLRFQWVTVFKTYLDEQNELMIQAMFLSDAGKIFILSAHVQNMGLNRNLHASTDCFVDCWNILVSVHRRFHPFPHVQSTFVVVNYPILEVVSILHQSILRDSQKLLNRSRSHWIQFSARHDDLDFQFLFFPLLQLCPLSDSPFLWLKHYSLSCFLSVMICWTPVRKIGETDPIRPTLSHHVR